jgi:hypothetical protein
LRKKKVPKKRRPKRKINGFVAHKPPRTRAQSHEFGFAELEPLMRFSVHTFLGLANAPLKNKIFSKKDIL